MKEEINKILDKLYLEFEKAGLTAPEYSDLRDYITNLQEEVEDLRENNYAYHQLMKMQNKREYRSKFLKEFQQEYNTNTFPDYDEIYKRYDKLKKENELLTKARYSLDRVELEKRIEKAIEYILEGRYGEEDDYESISLYIPKLLNILKGDIK